MNKLLAVLIAGFFATAGYAQNPTGSSAEQGNATRSASQQRAEQRKSAKTQGQVKKPTAGVGNTAEAGAIGVDKAAKAGEARADTRDDRRRNPDGSLKARSTQGGTPNN